MKLIGWAVVVLVVIGIAKGTIDVDLSSGGKTGARDPGQPLRQHQGYHRDADPEHHRRYEGDARQDYQFRNIERCSAVRCFPQLIAG